MCAEHVPRDGVDSPDSIPDEELLKLPKLLHCVARRSSHALQLQGRHVEQEKIEGEICWWDVL